MLTNSIPAGVETKRRYTERYRPQFHFTPQKNWMNDPNGLVYHLGEYHLFYQYNPFGDRWGHISWGHAVSKDLVHWIHLPIAISEKEGIMAFSGSTVVDVHNSSGFGEHGEPPLVAIYTGRVNNSDIQYQCLAFSNDNGRHWTTYQDNPVLDLNSDNFRDPNVFWYTPGEYWVMVVAKAAERKIAFYRSPNLKSWTFMSEFGPAGAVQGVWECPVLMGPLPVDGRPGEKRWVLKVDVSDGAVAGGSGGQYFIGQFDGERFVLEPGLLEGLGQPASVPMGTILAERPVNPAREAALWVDYGADFYAALNWNQSSDQRATPVWLGWLGNWRYGQDVPTSPWRGAQSIARKVALKSTPEGIRLTQEPVAELRHLRKPDKWFLEQTPILIGEDPLAQLDVRGQLLEIDLTIDLGTANEVGLKVREGYGEKTVISYNRHESMFKLDRSRSGQSSFSPVFPAVHTAPFKSIDGQIRFHVFVDASSIELFAQDGSIVMTAIIFPNPESQAVSVFAIGGAAKIISLEIWPIRSIWRKGK